VTFREPAWACPICGYAMDAASPVVGASQHTPKEDDVSMCMNCGQLFMRHADRWRLMTALEKAELPPGMCALLDHMETARRRSWLSIVKEWGGRA
jgi:ribosomal protein S27AE